ncbi:MAG: molybdopterin-dependent oxidoreductase [Faecalicatena sp.]|uniref:molybdopterin-dependent oxidoreductase n=1 Tax=Faecalicatena sp. TaxID=2005360 RepID=UPI00258B81F7|nr:molybdopterin cofactor-binding domain-containing protein [Faecalicatena sp.]MCI6464916.1 molybdopterin-dependent oxidoreductase [Faecalicatena sp.]MDY5619882.1 molybdopterin cofactor-binding domain-containing protein [Lachnospiraceae bacterium]
MDLELEKIELIVNGKKVCKYVPPAMRLADFLREELHLIGTKKGCNAGECGTCSVLINGVLKKSCMIPVKKVNHCEILTIEGIGKDGLDIIQRCFMKVGAVQCGYCTPGMIMAATAILKKNRHPDQVEIRKGLGGNICRCTGYAKIIEAIELARDILNHEKSADCLEAVTPETNKIIGSRIERVDARGKVMGALEYAADMTMPRMLNVHLVRSREVHAQIQKIDYEKALEMPGVEAVITSEDVPGIDGFGVYYHDQPVLAKEKIRFYGEPVAAIVAETLEEAQEAEKCIEITYKKLPIVSNIAEAIDCKSIVHEDYPDNVVSTTSVIKGDVESGFHSSDVIIEQEYSTQSVDHAYLETEAGLAYCDPDGVLVVKSCDQDITHHRMLLAKILGMPINKIRVIMTPVGGGFGGKEDMIYQGILAIAALKTKRPVKLVFSRQDSMIGSSKRHPVLIRHKIGLSKDGRIRAIEVNIKSDGGAYCFSTKGTVAKSAILGAGPYEIENVKVVSTGYYTNNTPSGAMRTFGILQPTFAIESTMDICSKRLGIDPIELRLINGVKDGAVTHTQQVLGSVSYCETLKECAKLASWEPGPSDVRGQVRKDVKGSQIAQPYIPGYEFKSPAALELCQARFKYGRGVGSGWYGIGRCATVDKAGAFVEIDDGGTAMILTGVTEIGEGILTVLTQIAADELGMYPQDITIGDNDTARAPEAAHAGASRQSYMIGNAVLNACRDVKEKFIREIAAYWNVDSSSICMKDRRIFVQGHSNYDLSLKEAVDICKKVRGYVPLGSGTYTAHHEALDPVNGKGNPWQAYVFGSQIAEVAVDTYTGEVHVLGIWASHDVGRAINPQGIEGQIEGGAVQSLGQAIMENFELSEGVPINRNFAKYILPTSVDVPKVYTNLVEDRDPFSPLGAKGIGEPAPLPTTPAIVNAIYDAVGVRITSLPATPEKILNEMAK